MPIRSDTTFSSAVYDAADSRLVTTEIPASTGAHCCDGVDDGLFVLGRQDSLDRSGQRPAAAVDGGDGEGAAGDQLRRQPSASGRRGALGGRSAPGAPSTVAAYAGIRGAAVTRRSSSARSTAHRASSNAISDRANWGAEIALPADDVKSATQQGARSPQLVSGPAGTFLLYENDAAGGSTGTVYRFWIRKLDGTTLGPRHLVVSGPR